MDDEDGDVTTMISTSGFCGIKSTPLTLSLITRFVDTKHKNTTTRIRILLADDDDVAELSQLMDSEIVYYELYDAISRGWTGKHLVINLDEYEDIDIDILESLETGIYMYKDKGVLVWNSQEIFIYTPHCFQLYNHVRKENTRSLSPRLTQMES